MLKQVIEYVDYNGNPKKEDFYFHLSVVEMTRLNMELGKPLDEYVKELHANQQEKPMLELVERLVLSAYGQKTTDGKTFRKSKELREEFEYSQAYAELFIKLITDQSFAQEFAQGIMDDGQGRKNTVAPQVISQ